MPSRGTPLYFSIAPSASACDRATAHMTSSARRSGNIATRKHRLQATSPPGGDGPDTRQRAKLSATRAGLQLESPRRVGMGGTQSHRVAQPGARAGGGVGYLAAVGDHGEAFGRAIRLRCHSGRLERSKLPAARARSTHQSQHATSECRAQLHQCARVARGGGWSAHDCDAPVTVTTSEGARRRAVLSTALCSRNHCHRNCFRRWPHAPVSDFVHLSILRHGTQRTSPKSSSMSSLVTFASKFPTRSVVPVVKTKAGAGFAATAG